MTVNFLRISYTVLDNAAMIAWASMHRFLAGESDDYSIDHRVKWAIEDIDS